MVGKLIYHNPPEAVRGLNLDESRDLKESDTQLFALEQVQTRLSNLRYGIDHVASRKSVDVQSQADLLRISKTLQSVIDAAMDELLKASGRPKQSKNLNQSGVQAALQRISEEPPWSGGLGGQRDTSLSVSEASGKPTKQGEI